MYGADRRSLSPVDVARPYELLAKYPRPDSVPAIARPSDGWAWEDYGVRDTPVARCIVSLGARASGLDTFVRTLSPDALEALLRDRSWRPHVCGPLDAAAMVFQADSLPATPARKAAALSAAALSLSDDILAGELTCDEFHGRPLEMGQYRNLFGTNLDLRKGVWTRASDTRTFAVLCKGHMFCATLPLHGDREGRDALTDLFETVIAQPHGESQLALLSAVGGFRSLALSENASRSDLEQLQRVLFTVCLDVEHTPHTDEQCGELAQIRNYTNRWYASSLQLVVFANGRSAILCSASANIDGNTMTRAAAEIRRRACATGDSQRRPGTSDRLLLAPRRLEGRLGVKAVNAARAYVQPLLSRQPSVFTLRGYGRTHFERAGLPPVPAFVVAIHVALRKLFNGHAHVRQYLSQATYRCMGIRLLATHTPTMAAASHALSQRHDEPKALLDLALLEYQSRTRLARSHLPITTLRQLHYHSAAGRHRRWIETVDRASGFLLRKLVGIDAAPWSVVLSHPSPSEGVPIVGRPGVAPPGRRVGIHYQIAEEELLLVMSSSTEFPNLKFTEALLDACAIVSRCALAADSAPRDIYQLGWRRAL
jgi:hypothetical protein